MLTLLHTISDPKQYQNLLRTYAHTLPPIFQEKLRKLRRPQDKQASLLGRMLLNKGMEIKMGEKVGWEKLQYNEFGKPYWENSKVQFNIAHAQELVVCVLQQDHPIGIDVEQIRPIEIADFRSQMTKREWQRVESAKNQARVFFEYWTQKEAVMKANGKGMSLGLKTWELEENLESVILQDEIWYVKSVNVHPYYCCHIATPFSITEKINLIEVKF